MKQYKVESFIYYSKITLDTHHIQKSSTTEIQAKLDEMAELGWTLTNTTSTNFGAAIYIYLFFEKTV